MGDGRELVRLRHAIERAGGPRIVVPVCDLEALLASPAPVTVRPVDLDGPGEWAPEVEPGPEGPDQGQPDMPPDIPAPRGSVDAHGRGRRVVALSADRASAKRLAEAAWTSQPVERVAKHGPWQEICEQQPWMARELVDAALRAIEFLVDG